MKLFIHDNLFPKSESNFISGFGSFSFSERQDDMYISYMNVLLTILSIVLTVLFAILTTLLMVK